MSGHTWSLDVSDDAPLLEGQSPVSETAQPLPLTVVSSMNSTRTWVTPPREPGDDSLVGFSRAGMKPPPTSSPEDASDLDELDGNLALIHDDDSDQVSVTCAG